METLYDMLTHRRPARSQTEEIFINKFIRPLNPIEDTWGNLIVTIGDSPTTLFSSHTDTVHKTDGMQKLYLSENHLHADKDVLGADCGTGVWIMVNMINAGINGLYIFHRDEEIGGKGSSYIAEHTQDILTGIERAVAFDRMGADEIITSQFGGKCCSDEFAEALSSEIGLNYAPSPMGTFTDTANYVDLVPECTNISVGYAHQHTASEFQDVEHLDALMTALLKVNWDALPTVRDTSDVGDDPYNDYGYSNYDEASYDELLYFVERYPEEAAELLEAYGVTQLEIERLLPKVAA